MTVNKQGNAAELLVTCHQFHIRDKLFSPYLYTSINVSYRWLP